MDWDILKKEKEYYEENERIELKAKQLLQKVDDVMKIQDNFMIESNDAKPSTDKLKKIPRSSLGTFASNFADMTPDNDPNLPSATSIGEMGLKGMHHFYRAKIKAMQSELDKLHLELKTKNTELKQSQKDLHQNIDEKEKWFSQYNLGKATVNKFENQVTALCCKLQAKESENVAMKKEIENLKKEVKTINVNMNGSEVRLNRALEENEKNKIILNRMKKEEKDLKESHRKQIQELTVTVQQIEKHKNELLHGFKKQLQLIDNLKKQRAHLETFNLSEMAEAEFMKILEWKIDT